MTKIVECLTDNENQDFDVDTDEWQNIAVKLFKNLVSHKEVAEHFCLKDIDYEKVFFDIRFTNSVETHELNRTYRDKDYPADIITFALFADDDNASVPDGQVILGDIIIALDKVEEMAKEENKTFDYELKFLIAHGILHLLGFDHRDETEYNFVVKHQNLAIEELA
ncbi:rRNA maturation RNase YbeY [bacterium]|nr:rRNA maturation RNase YbeY [bacterium]